MTTLPAGDDFTLSNAIVRHVVAVRVHYAQLTRCNQLNPLAGFDRGPFADRQGRMFARGSQMVMNGAVSVSP
jgi:hypothetical protein